MKLKNSDFLNLIKAVLLVGLIIFAFSGCDGGSGGGGGGGGNDDTAQPELVSIEVTPANSAIPFGITQQFAATGIYSDSTTQDITDSVSWSSSDSGVAIISNASGSKGLASSVDAGSATITATYTSTGISGTTNLTVTDAELVSIELTPADTTIPSGIIQQFLATGTYTDSTTQDITDSVSWSSSDSGVAIISNASGSKGLASSVDAGSATITATYTSTGISGTTNLTVTDAELVSIELTPADTTIPSGIIQQFSATGTYTDSTTQDITNSVSWSSSDSGVAIISNASGSKGLASSVDVGDATITATDTSTGISDNTDLTVSDAELVSIELGPADTSIFLGNTQQFSATGTYTDSSTQDITDSVTWNSSDTDVTTISNASGSQGLASSVAAGTAGIVAIDPASGISGNTDLTVINRSFYLSPPPDNYLTEELTEISQGNSYQIFIYQSPQKIYETDIDGDIQGGSYFFSLWLAATGSQTLHAEIVMNPGVDEIVLADTDFTVDSQTYTEFTETVDGIDPNIPFGGVLALRLTGDSISQGIGLLFANDCVGYIQVLQIND